MNVQEYISSGIVESYVLGLASVEERREFEHMCAQHPEVLQARIGFELALEKQAMENTVVPPVSVKEKLMLMIQQDAPAGQSKVITMQNSGTSRKSGMLRYAAAASVILLLGAAYFAYTFYDKNKKLNKSMESMSQSVESMQKKVDQMEEYVKMITDPNVSVVNLAPTTPAKASASIYWDSTTTDVYMVVKNLPKLPSDKQYQLWSIINGQDGSLQPNSMGLFDMSDDHKIILKMPKVQKADAFAITIEKRGNTGGPDLKQVQTFGKTGL
ncbi:MAG: anti-sigma factor [Chitinophagaceae bacterium]|nr:anti-sigma factor [Chitinophagaceae bacterium]